jgi:hypothetical protein
MKKLITLAAGLTLVVGASTAAQAQVCNVAAAPGTCTVIHTVSVTAPSILRLTLSSTTTTLTNPVEADFDNVAGVSDVAAMTVTVKSNKAASATIHSAAANWTGGAGTKAIADLGWSTTGGTPYAPITGSGVTVVTSGKGNRTSTVSWNTQWHIATDEPGLYSLPVTFTLVVP